MIPYGHQSIDKKDLKEVLKTLKSGWLTQGPAVSEFEKKLAEYCGAKFCVVCSNGTAALQAAFFAADLKNGDEFITTPITFPSTANAGITQGAKPVFVDIEETTGNMDPDLIERKITKRTKAIVPVDYTGRPVDLRKISEIAKKHNLVVIEDACQALGAQYQRKKIGSLSDLTVFSFHPVKTITTGEGGAILTDNPVFYERMKKFVNHGITKTDFIFEPHGDWYFEMQELGNNFRLSDLQCALGLSQLKKIGSFLKKRKTIVKKYQAALENEKQLILPEQEGEDISSAWHLYVVRLKNASAGKRRQIFDSLRKAGIGVQIHHIPVYFHPYYQRLGYKRGICPKAERFYDSIISLPLFPDLKEREQNFVIKKLKTILKNEF